jgi:hypothetical protein
MRLRQAHAPWAKKTAVTNHSRLAFPRRCAWSTEYIDTATLGYRYEHVIVRVRALPPALEHQKEPFGS